MAKPLRICLAASGGGHVRQILDIEPVWKDRDHFFVTEDTSLGRSIAKEHDTYFVPHVALGQARLGAPFKMLAAAVKSLFVSARIVWRTRPDVVITTGAGSMYFTVFWARLMGARIILEDSFARFDKPSAFARLAGPLAHVKIAQSAESGRNWPGSVTFDPFKLLDTPRPHKEPLLFATVGATLPFDRLVRLVATAKERGLIPEKVLIQTGEGGFKPEGLDCVESLPFDEVKDVLNRADIVVCHGGTGSLITALRVGCRVIAIPRTFARGEHYDDHQSEITGTFADRGLINVAHEDDDFAHALAEVRAREPRCATTEPDEVIAYLEKELARLSQ
jgi:UDP-N-acetylglucosamine--N-acetylmuramyl-(pentapeptide) pyrophosphoryl-undecaprenol N-acetylglucosamine transferase